MPKTSIDYSAPLPLELKAPRARASPRLVSPPRGRQALLALVRRDQQLVPVVPQRVRQPLRHLLVLLLVVQQGRLVPVALQAQPVLLGQLVKPVQPARRSWRGRYRGCTHRCRGCLRDGNFSGTRPRCCFRRYPSCRQLPGSAPCFYPEDHSVSRFYQFCEGL